jgi:hypothetical protein
MATAAGHLLVLTGTAAVHGQQAWSDDWTIVVKEGLGRRNWEELAQEACRVQVVPLEWLLSVG